MLDFVKYYREDIDHPPNHPVWVMLTHPCESYHRDILINKELSYAEFHGCV